MGLQVVNFEQAKTLKKLGFPQELSGNTTSNEYRYYSDNIDKNCEDFEMIDEPFIPYSFETSIYNYYRAPYLEEVAKWLRDKKNISLEPYRTAAGWICMIVDIPSGTDRYQVGYNDELGDDKSSGQFTTFEKSLSVGIDKVIKMLKRK